MVRDASEVGRFPGAAPPTRVELTIHKEGEKKEEEGGCRRWLRKAFPCCCKRQNHASYDVTDRVELVQPPTPAVPPQPPKPKPENGEARDMEGSIFRVMQHKITSQCETTDTNTRQTGGNVSSTVQIWDFCSFSQGPLE